MHKYISAIVLSTLAGSAMAHGKWEVGAVGGWGIGSAKETLIISTTSPVSISRYKFTLKANGLMGGVTLGYNIQRAKNIFGLHLGLSKDFYSARTQGIVQDRLSNIPDNAKRDLKRRYTVELAAKIGRMISDDINLYGKLGAVRSVFREQYGNPPIDIRHDQAGWGGVIGLGVQKAYDTVKVGLGYDYQYYQRLGSTLHYHITPVRYKNKSKFQPQYHNVFFTISKSF